MIEPLPKRCSVLVINDTEGSGFFVVAGCRMRLFVLIVSNVMEGFIFAQRRFNRMSAAGGHQGPRHLAYTGQQRTGETRRRMRAP